MANIKDIYIASTSPNRIGLCENISGERVPVVSVPGGPEKQISNLSQVATDKVLYARHQLNLPRERMHEAAIVGADTNNNFLSKPGSLAEVKQILQQVAIQGGYQADWATVVLNGSLNRGSDRAMVELTEAGRIALSSLSGQADYLAMMRDLYGRDIVLNISGGIDFITLAYLNWINKINEVPLKGRGGRRELDNLATGVLTSVIPGVLGMALPRGFADDRRQYSFPALEEAVDRVL